MARLRAKRGAARSRATGPQGRRASVRRASAAASRCCCRWPARSRSRASGLGVTQIAELLGREKSQVSRALKALSEYGLVERNEDSSYRLGWRLYALAQLAGERRLLEAATPMMRRLAHRLGERVHLSVLQGTETLTVLSESPGPHRRDGRAGPAASRPAYCTSAGRALLLDWERRRDRGGVRRRRVRRPRPRTRSLPRRSWRRPSRAARAQGLRRRRRGVRARSDRRRRPGARLPPLDHRVAQRVRASLPVRRAGDEAAHELLAVSADLVARARRSRARSSCRPRTNPAARAPSSSSRRVVLGVGADRDPQQLGRAQPRQRARRRRRPRAVAPRPRRRRRPRRR